MKKRDNSSTRQTAFWENKLSFLDTFLYQMRITRIVKAADFHDKIVADTGCGFNYRFLRSVETMIQKGYAVDMSLDTKYTSNTLELVISNLNESIGLDNESVDIVSSMAILEHLDNPEQYLREVYRILRPGGVLVMTIPSVWAKPVLEFMAYTLKIISEEEIRDHKTYYEKKSLFEILEKTGFKKENIKHSYFQFGMNNFVRVTK